MKSNNAIFNPVAYKLSGGVIIDFDPAADSRRRARERQIRRMEMETEREFRRAENRRKLRLQRKIGLLCVAIALTLTIGGFHMEELWTIAAASLSLSIAFLATKKTLI